MRKSSLFAGFITAVAALVLTSACTTVNNLAYYDLTGTSIALDMLVPPEPTVDVDYSMPYDSNNQLLTIITIGANLMKSSEAEMARVKLTRALSHNDIPGMISGRLIEDIADTLDARVVARTRNAEVLLELEIREYGIEANSGTGEVDMVMRLQAGLYHQEEHEMIWQRRISVTEEITPGLFGFNDILGDAVTIAGLRVLSEEQLAEGFERIAREITAKTARKLQEDLREARHR